MYRIIFSNYDDVRNPHYGGGGALAVHEIAKRLAGDFNVTVLTGKYRNCRNETIDGVNYERIGANIFGPKIGQLIFQIALSFYARRKKYDLWVESFTPPFSTSFLPLFTKKPVIGLAHTLAGKDAARKYKLPFHFIEKQGLKVYQNFIAVSKFVKTEILAANPKAQVHVIPNGVDWPETKRQPLGEYILFLGRMEVDQKGLDLLLKAYCQILDKVNFPLYIAGAGTAKEESKLKKLINSLGLAGSVLLFGRTGEKEKKMLYERAAFSVIPSRFETFSMAALESLAFGVPIMAFDIPGLAWLPPNIAVKTKPFDVPAFAEGMLKLAKDAALRHKMGKQGRELAKRYSWGNSARQYHNFFSGVLGRYPILFNPSEDKRRIIDKIVEKKLPCYFISPHLDDAALSAADLISHLAGKTELVAVTVFTSAGPKPYSLSIKRFLKLHGYTDAKKMYEDRRKEDEKVYKGFRAKVVHLGFVDALWRRKGRQSFLSGLVGKIIPEFEYLYPTYRAHVVSGKPHKEDLKLRLDVIKALGRVIPPGREHVIFCPAGFGGHVDHILVREVCEKMFKNVILWKDATYESKVRDTEENQGYRQFVWQDDAEKKYALLQIYQSQIPQMFAAGRKPENFETYFVSNKLSL